jgi:hypothetical protein
LLEADRDEERRERDPGDGGITKLWKTEADQNAGEQR